MIRWCKSIVIIVAFAVPNPTYAFIGNPADTAALLKILANSLAQLIQLKNVVSNARNQLTTIRDINSGLTNVLDLLNTMYPHRGLTLYRDWVNVAESKNKLEALYGAVTASREALAQRHMDSSVVDAIIMNNEILKHSFKVDQAGESIKAQSMTASPKGAARLTAQGTGIGLHVQNQSLRVQSAQLKLQAQNIANQNSREKATTQFFLSSSQQLKTALKNKKSPYNTPRF